jgi:tetratricopeptide (TPR) repeat protein
METPEKPGFSWENFEPDVFWQEHGRKVTWAIVGLVAAGLLAYLYQSQAQQRLESAAARLANARDAAALEQIIRDHPRQEVTAQALVRLADLQYKDGKYAEAQAAYQQLLTAFPGHAFANSARLGLAALLEAQAKYEDARNAYSQLVSSGGQSYVVIAARIGVARCTELLGQKKEARQLYEELLPLVQNSPWQNEVYLRWTILARDVPKEPVAPAAATATNAPVPFMVPPPAGAPAK